MKRPPLVVTRYQRLCDENIAFWRKLVVDEVKSKRARQDTIDLLGAMVRGWLYGARQMCRPYVPKRFDDYRIIEQLEQIYKEAEGTIAREQKLASEWLLAIREVNRGPAAR